MEISFSKMEGLGNDFIIIDDRNRSVDGGIAYPTLSRIACDRNFGIGGDGLIVVSESETCDLKFSIFNADGSEPEMCGNGMRCFARLAFEKKIVTTEEFSVETLAGVIRPRVVTGEDGRVEMVTVDMGEPVLSPEKIPFVSERELVVSEPLELARGPVPVTAVSMGNPHAVVFVTDLEGVDIDTMGPEIEKHGRFPEGVNVEFVEVLDEGEIRMKVWERGVGRTLACGTGACAAVVAASLDSRAGRSAVVHLEGGDLHIEWDKSCNRIYKTGPARLVFEGSLLIDPVAESTGERMSA